MQALQTNVRSQTGQTAEPAGDDDLALCIANQVARIILKSGSVVIDLRVPVGGTPLAPMVVPWVRKSLPRHEILYPDGSNPSDARPIRSETRARLVEAIARARGWLADLLAGRAKDLNDIAAHEGCSERTVRSTIGLAFLSPRTVRAAVEGTLPGGVGVVSLVQSSIDWSEQRTMQ